MRALAISFVVASIATGCGGGTADAVVVLAASSTTDAMEQVRVSAAGADSSIDVQLVLAGSPSLIAQLEAGVDADILITADRASMERAIMGGLINSDPQVVATNSLVLAVAAGNPADVTGLADLADASVVVGACAPTVPCGLLATTVTIAAGVEIDADTEELSVRALAAKIRLGEVDAGLVYRSDALALMLDTVDVVGLAAAHNEYLVAFIDDDPPADARRFVALLLSSEGREAFTAAGFSTP